MNNQNLLDSINISLDFAESTAVELLEEVTMIRQQVAELEEGLASDNAAQDTKIVFATLPGDVEMPPQVAFAWKNLMEEWLPEGTKVVISPFDISAMCSY